MIPGRYKGLACFSIYACPWCAPGSKNSTSYILVVQLSPRERYQCPTLQEPSPHPWNQRYYEPDIYKIDPYQLPSLVYLTIVYDGVLFVSLHHGDVPIISEPYPPGTRIEEPSSSNNSICSSTIMDIPLDPTRSPQYLILFDNCSTKSVPARDMSSIIPKPHTNASNSDCHTFFLRSFASTLKISSTMRDSITKVFLPNHPMGSTTSATNHT